MCEDPTQFQAQMKNFTFLCCLQIHNNVLFNWNSLASSGRVRPIIYYQTDSDANEEDHTVGPVSVADLPVMQNILNTARSIGWETYEVPRVSSLGLPYFKDMFLDAARRFPRCTFYAYANGDIMFDDGLLNTLDAVHKVQGPTVLC
jgi:hypothetical protein